MTRWSATRPAAFLLVVLLAGALMARAQAAEPVSVRVGYASIGVDNRPFVGGSTAATAHARHFLEEEFKDDPDVKIEWFFFRGAGPAVNEAIANGQLDFALQGDLPSVIGRANGLKTKIVLMSVVRDPIYVAVPPDSTISSVKDLRGRKVALFRGTNLHLAAVKVLAANGLAERDVSFINMDFATANAALASREVDAAIGEYALVPLVDQGLAKVAYTTKGDNPAFGRNAHVLVTEDFEIRHPDITARVVKAFVNAAAWSSDEKNREALFATWSLSGVPAKIYRLFFEGDPLPYRLSPLLDDFIVEQYATQAKLAKEYGLIRREVDLHGWLDPRYLDAALGQLGLDSYWTRYGSNGKPQAF